jgi:hypothetical protein
LRKKKKKEFVAKTEVESNGEGGSFSGVDKIWVLISASWNSGNSIGNSLHNFQSQSLGATPGQRRFCPPVPLDLGCTFVPSHPQAKKDSVDKSDFFSECGIVTVANDMVYFN